MHSRTSASGVGAVELVIYTAILGLLTVAVITTTLSLNSTFQKSRAERVLVSAGSTAIERVTRDIRDADSINVPASTLNATSSVLTLVTGATTTQYRLQNETLLVTVNGVDLGAVTAQNIRATSFVAVRYTSPKSDMVRIILDLTRTDRFATSTKRFTTSAVLRGGYTE
jgi:ABC-type lipoprotein release transport system permease subunit